MLQNFHYVDHVERSPCHKFSLAPIWNEWSYRCCEPNWWTPTTLVGTPLLREYLNAKVRDYLNADPADWWIT